MPDKNNMQACDRTILFLSVFLLPSHLIQTGKIIALTVAIADPHHMVRWNKQFTMNRTCLRIAWDKIRRHQIIIFRRFNQWWNKIINFYKVCKVWFIPRIIIITRNRTTSNIFIWNYDPIFRDKCTAKFAVTDPSKCSCQNDLWYWKHIIILNDIPLANNLHNNVITLTAKIDAKQYQ